MEKSLDKITWEDAIIRVVKECGGSATLKELYQNVPQIREVPPRLDANHIIRAYLRRMTRVSGKLKRIGLGIYALLDIKLEQTLFEKIQEGKTKTEMFKAISATDSHSYVEGMLLELGDIYGYLTYTADPSGKFGSKPLGKLATVENFPNFTSSSLLNIAKGIDVIWFKKRALVVMPKHTFDVEKTTDFSKALHRAYQLRDFKITFYVVSQLRKDQQFQKKLATDPYTEISDRFFFRSFEDIFSLYEIAIKHSELKERIIIEP
ncbi:MAG TPA: hypothetical protein ACFYD3_07770 [Candidatus Hypogeohydataceae bacterium YC41]